MNRIKELREEKAESIVEASKNSGIPYQTFRNYEIGKRKPNGENAVKLADYFEVSTAYIMGLNTAQNENEITITRNEYERLKAIEQKYNEIKSLVSD